LCIKVGTFITMTNDKFLFGFALKCYFLASQETGKMEATTPGF